MKFYTKVTGLQQLDKTFSKLPRAMQNKAYRQSLREGAKVVQEAARVNVRKASDPFSGLLHKRGSIRIYNLRKFRGNFRVAVQIQRGLTNSVKRDKDGKPVRVGMYAAVLEYGSTKLNRKPRPWIRPAIRENKAEAVSAIARGMSVRIDDALKEARK